MIQLFTPRKGEQRGAILILSGIILAALITVVALVVDIGHQSMNKRELHTIADIAAQDSVGSLGVATSGSAIVPAAVVASAARNAFAVPGTTSNRLVVDVGTWDPTTKTFTVLGTWDSKTNAYTGPADSSSASAVRVTASMVQTYDFLRGSNTVSAQAVATSGVAGETVGSYALSFDSSQSAILNSLLGGALGNAVNVTALGYGGLASSNVTLNQLAATPTAAALHIGTPSQVATAKLTEGQIAQMELDALNSQNNPPNATTTAAITALGVIVSDSAGSAGKVSIGNGGLGVGNGSAADADIPINGLGLVTEPAIAISNGKNFITVAVPASLNLGVVGASVNLGVQLLEGPQTKFGPVGTNVATAQARIQLEIKENVVGGTEALDIPLMIEGFGGQGTIKKIDCTHNTVANPPDVTITGQPNALTVAVGNFSSYDPSKSLANQTLTPATILSTLGVLGGGGVALVTGSLTTTILQGAAADDLFTGPFPEAFPPNATPLGPRGQPPGNTSPYNNNVAGVSAGLSTAIQASGSLGPLFTILGSVVVNAALGIANTVINELFGALGIGLSGVAVWNPPVPSQATGVQCAGTGIVGSLVQ